MQRIAGLTRYGTAGAGTATLEGVATEAYPAGADHVIIATGEVFADALAASGLAGATDSPILLVQKDEVPISSETRAALDELGTTSATIVGGIAAVSQAVEDSLNDDLGLTTDRIFGATRYETAAAIADAIGPYTSAIVASGEVAADALSAGPISANTGTPILLTQKDEVRAATSDALAGVTDLIIAGGTARISEQTRSDLEDASSDPDGATVLAGLDRQETAADIADYEVATLGWAPTAVLLAAPNAPNDDFSPDALVAGPLGGLREAPILIVDGVNTLGPDADGFITDHSDTIAEVFCIGGTAVLSDDLCDEALAIAQSGVSAAGSTDAPELIDVEFVNLTSTGGSSGVGQLLVKAVFDEAVLATPIVQTGFKIYTAYGAPAPAEIQNSNSAQLDPNDPTKVQVVFDVFGGGSYGAIEGTVFTVVANTVQDSDGKVNPEGELPGLIDQTFAPGITRNPDLTAVAVQTADTVFDFTFDSGVSTATASDFRMVDSSGAVPRIGSGMTIPAGSTPANSVVRVTFPAPTAPATGVRGVALEGAVVSALGNTNPQQAADVTGTAGLSDSPDLVSIAIDDANDRITFTFDENVDTVSGLTGIRAGFHVYYRQTGGSTRDQVSNGVTDRSSTDPRSVIAQFPAGAVNEFVAGAYVDNGAVSRDGSAGAKPNRVDEEGVGSTFAAGAYLGPELASVVSENTTDVFNTVTGRRVRFTFDELISATIVTTSFFVTDSDGNRTNLTGCARDAAPNDNRVTCAVLATTGTVFTEIGDSELATVASGAVTGVALRNTGPSGTNIPIANHEEAAAAPGTARNVTP